MTTEDECRINTVRVRTLASFIQGAAPWTDSCVDGVESFIPHGGGKRWFWGGEQCSASEVLVLLKDTLQIKQAMGATCGHAGSRHPITAGPSTHTPSFFQPAGEPGFGLQISNYPSLSCALYGPSFFFFFVSVKLCLSCISQFALRANNLPGQKYIHSSPTSVSGPFNWGSMTVWLPRDNGSCVPPNVNPEKCHT